MFAVSALATALCAAGFVSTSIIDYQPTNSAMHAAFQVYGRSRDYGKSLAQDWREEMTPFRGRNYADKTMLKEVYRNRSIGN